MWANQACNFKKTHFFFPCKYCFQLVIAQDDLLVGRVLKIVELDVGPDLLEGLSASGFSGTAKELLHRWGEGEGLHDSCKGLWCGRLGGIGGGGGEGAEESCLGGESEQCGHFGGFGEERSCGAKLAQSDALTSVIRILDTQFKEFHETAISILYNLSLSDDPCIQNFSPQMCIPRLVPFLKQLCFSGHSIVILEQLLCTKEARFLAVETEGCIAAIVELLETGNDKEQEHALSILMSLCSQYEKCCKLAMKEGIIPSLFGIAVNGNDRGKENALNLLQQLRDIGHEDDEEDLEYNDVHVCRIPYTDSKKVSSKRNGFFRKVATKLKKW